MSFPFHSQTKQKLSLPLQAEPISIGCEAWIDVSRFCASEKSLHNTARTSSDNSLTKSFADLRRKFRKISDEDLG
jgi:hypothetical protein